MDRVRLGRVLGRGARMAARTVYEAVDAATTPNAAAPSHTRPTTRAGAPSASTRPQLRAESSTKAAPGIRAGGVLRNTASLAGRVSDSSRAARRGVLAPVKRASMAVTLQVTGSFFALFALSFAVAACRFGFAAAGSHAQPQSRLWLYAGLAAVFGYFALSNFLKAGRISRTA